MELTLSSRRAQQRPCDATELVRGVWRGAEYVLREACAFELFSPRAARSCLRETTVVIAGNSVGRGLHFELVDLVGALKRPPTGLGLTAHSEAVWTF